MARPHASGLAAGGVAVLLAGCTVGPHHPDAAIPLPPVRTSVTIAPASGPTQRLSVGGVPLAHWWRAFGSPQLDALVDRALARNNDIASAEASLRQAREQAFAVQGAQAPQADLSYQAERTRVSRALSNPLADPNAYEYTLHTAQVTVAYPVDLFGGGRNRVRSARAASAVAADRLAAARTTVVGNLVVAVLQHAALDAQITSQQRAITDDRDLVVLLQRRQALGDVGEADVAAQLTVLGAAEAALPPLIRQRDHELGLIQSLVGTPAGAPAAPLPTLDQITLPADLPVGLPTDIVANRPDVRAAEAQMKGAASDVGSAIAARLPAIQLSGSAGGSATRLAEIFASGNPFYTLLGGITQPLFHAGQLRHQQHAAEAALEGAKAQYRAVALQAFLDVDDALSGLRTDADALDAATRTDAAAQRTLLFTRRQVQLGAVGTFALLNASSSASQAATQRISARAARLIDTVALFQACGYPTDRP